MTSHRKRGLILLLANMVFALLLAAPVSARADPDPVRAAITWLDGQQFADGGFGLVILNKPTSNAPMTADVVYALALAGENPDGPAWTVGGKSALDALAALAPAYVKNDPGQAARVARAVIAAGGNPRAFGGLDLLAIIQAGYNPANGRFDRNTTYQQTVFRSAMAIEALQLAGVAVEPAAYAALRTVQTADGGWPAIFIGTEGDEDTTGKVMQVLGRAGTDARCDVRIARGSSFLAAVQTGGGAWANPLTGTANANSTALAVTGLRATGHDPAAAPFIKGEQSGWQALLSFQEAGGAFVYSIPPDSATNRLTATTDALFALLEPFRTTAEHACPAVYLPLILAR